MAKKEKYSDFIQYLRSMTKDPELPFAKERKEESNYIKIRNKIEQRVLLPRHVMDLFHLTHNKLFQWDQLNLRFSSKENQDDNSWRRFSIADLLRFAIIIAVKDLGLRLKDNQPLINWVGRMNLVDSILLPFTQGKKVAIYFNRSDIWGIYVSKSIPEKWFMDNVNKSTVPIIVIPLNEIFKWVLQKSRRPDFYVQISKYNEYMFFIDGKRVIIEELPTSPPQ